MQFEITYDKDRKNLLTNTVTFAQKFCRSQPKFKTRKQSRKEGQMKPEIGFYDNTDIKLWEMNRNCERVPDMEGQASRS